MPRMLIPYRVVGRVGVWKTYKLGQVLTNKRLKSKAIRNGWRVNYDVLRVPKLRASDSLW